MRFSKCVFSFLVLFFAPAAFSQKIKPEYQAAFDWIDSLAPKEWQDTPLVRIEFYNIQFGGKFAEVYGFLLEENDETLVRLSLDFEVETEPRTEESAKIGTISAKVVKLDIAEEVRRIVKGQARILPRRDPFGDSHMDTEVCCFLLARACAAKGFIREANRMAALSHAALKENHLDDDSSLKVLVSNEIANRKMMDAKKRIRDGDKSREVLLDEFKTIFRHCPRGPHYRELVEIITMLSRMVSEDAAYSDKEKPNRIEILRDIVYKLRDQGQKATKDRPLSHYGFSLDVVRAPYAEGSPAQLLIDADLEAIPHLINALGDKRFTRCVDDSNGTLQIVRVQDWALHLICEISGREFRTLIVDEFGAVNIEVNNAEKLVHAWWADIQEKGEPTVLAEGVSAARADSLTQANRLISKYPSFAVDAIRKGVANFELTEKGRTAKAARARVPPPGIGLGGGNIDEEAKNLAPELIQSTRELPYENDLEAMLRVIFQADFSLPTRLAAAKELLARNDPDIGRRMADLFVERVSLEERENLTPLIKLLLDSRGVKAVECISESFQQLYPVERISAVELLGETKASIPDDQLESFLIMATKDETRQLGLSTFLGGSRYTNARVCDFAGYYLQMRRGKHFDLSQSEYARTVSLREIRNEYFESRRTNNAEPVITPSINLGAPKAVTDPLVARFIEADEENLVSMADEIRKLGVSALPRLQLELYIRELSDPQRVALQDLALEVANHAGALKVRPETTKLKELEERFTALTGKPLDGAQCVELMTAALAEMPESFTSIYIKFCRDDRLAGLIVEIQLGNANNGLTNAADKWSYESSMTKGSRQVEELRGGFVEANALKSMSNVADSIDRTLGINDEQRLAFDLKREVLIHFHFYRK